MEQQVLAAVKAYEKELSGSDIDYQITETVSLPEGATMYLFEGDDIHSSAIEHADGIIFVMRDWQSGRPETFEEIDEYSWVTLHGQEAVMLNGLPRAF